uniref:Uncharacterized protein n=1 Tax=Avena sativa TaxID=4498 RepID=A0ACD5VHS7_AVESA
MSVEENQQQQAFYAAAVKTMRGFKHAPPASTMDEAVAPQYYHELTESYVEAARRLPIADIPCLANCISIGGLAVGLADPVTNIILTTINAFARWPTGIPCPPPLMKPHDALEKTRKKSTFAAGAKSSRGGLVEFLLCYFRYLTQDQAEKLLDMAGNNLPLAVHIVEVGCCRGSGLLDPDAARTKTALQLAANSVVGCCYMAGGDLVRLMTWRYPRHLLLNTVLLDQLRGAGAGKQQLTPDCVHKICDLLRCSWPAEPTPAPPTPGTYRDTSGNVTTITQIRKDLFATTTISKDLVTTTTITSTAAAAAAADDDDGVHLSTELLVTDDDDGVNSSRLVCSWRENPDFLPLMKLSLLDTLHGFYIDALGMLPCHALRQRHLVPSILAAGHCYGPCLDPVSNIIVNSIWYHAVFPPLPEEDVSDDQMIGAADILDARSLARVESRSLDGLLAFVCRTHSISEQQAVLLLCQHRFDLSHSIFHAEKMFPDLAAAAAALVAKHPQPAAFGDFLTSLIPAAKLDRLRSLLSDKGRLRCVLSDDTLEQIKNMVTNETAHVVAAAAAAAPVPDLGQSALETVLSARRKTFKTRQEYVRTKLEKLLLEYSHDKLQGGHYNELGIVCGVVTNRIGSYSTCYHINFLASRDVPNHSNRSSSTLFFAEFWSIVDCQVEHSTNVPFCCPVGDFFDALSIRCLTCDGTSCKIAHPSSAEYVYFTGKTECGFPVHHEWGSDLGEMLESDFIYLDCKNDDEVAKILSEESSSSSPKSRRGVFFVPYKDPRAREESPSSQRNTRARTSAGFGGPTPLRKV